MFGPRSALVKRLVEKAEEPAKWGNACQPYEAMGQDVSSAMPLARQPRPALVCAKVTEL